MENCLEKGGFVRNNVFVSIIIWGVVQGDARRIDGAGQDIIHIYSLELNYGTASVTAFKFDMNKMK